MVVSRDPCHEQQCLTTTRVGHFSSNGAGGLSGRLQVADRNMYQALPPPHTRQDTTQPYATKVHALSINHIKRFRPGGKTRFESAC